MTFDPRSLFPRWKATRDFATVDELVAAVRKQLEIEEAGPDDAEAMHGQLAGALISGPATLARDPTLGSPRFQAGFLSGHLQAYLIRTVGPLRSEWILPTTVYAASLLTRGGAPPRGRSEPNIVALHTYASLRAAERGDLPLDVELGAFRWLAARYSIAVTSRLVEQLEAARIRRLELQVALESEQALDPPAAAAARNARRLRQCINSVERQIVVTDPGLPEIDRLRGALAGLLAVSGTGPVPAASDDTTSESYRGGRFGGELLASLIQGDMMPSETLRSICYRYGAALATPSGGTLLAEAPPTNALKAHTLGIHVLQQGVAAAPLDEELELALLTWLAARLEVPLTPDLVEHRKRFVARPKTPG